MKMGIVQPPPHYQPQERNCNEAQTLEKRKTLLRQNLQFSRCGNPNNKYVWAEKSQFETYNLSKQKTYDKNVVYDEVIKGTTSE